MRLASYRFDDGAGPARVDGDRIVDLRGLALDMPRLLAMLREGRAAIAHHHGAAVPLDRGRLLAPIPAPGMFLAVGLNYRDHAAETGRALPDQPAIFAKLRGTAAPPDAPLIRPCGVETLDYEAELGVVIGARLYRPGADEVRDAIAGYVVVNDVTVRAKIHPDRISLAKSAPGHGPFGPWITTADAVSDPHALAIRSFVNGEPRQASSTAEMHHRIDAIVATIADSVPLAPGDVIATGSPAGSGVGYDPPRFLRPGDLVRCEIEELGHIEQRVRDEG